MYPFEIIIKYVIFKPTRLDEIINDEWGLISKGISLGIGYKEGNERAEDRPLGHPNI